MTGGYRRIRLTCVRPAVDPPCCSICALFHSFSPQLKVPTFPKVDTGPSNSGQMILGPLVGPIPSIHSWQTMSVQPTTTTSPRSAFPLPHTLSKARMLIIWNVNYNVFPPKSFHSCHRPLMSFYSPTAGHWSRPAIQGSSIKDMIKHIKG